MLDSSWTWCSFGIAAVETDLTSLGEDITMPARSHLVLSASFIILLSPQMVIVVGHKANSLEKTDLLLVLQVECHKSYSHTLFLRCAAVLVLVHTCCMAAG